MAEAAGKVVYAALAGNVLIAVSKFIAAGYTGSAALLAEAVHSLVDCGNEVLLLYGSYRARRPADAQFPFGHGKELYFWCFVVAVLVFALGAGVSFYQGVHRLRHPEPVQHVVVNYVVLGVALVFEGGSWLYALHSFRRSKGQRGYFEAVVRAKDPTTFTVLFEDSAALLGLLVALAAQVLSAHTGDAAWDAAASLVIAGILAAAAVLLARETKSLLIGEAATPDVVAGILVQLRARPEIDEINEILTLHMGPDYILVNISLHVAEQARRAEVHRVFDDIDAAIRRRFPKVRRVFIESERPAAGRALVPLPPAAR